jgi:hypothetical protein
MHTDKLSHAEVYADGAVFWIGGSAEHPRDLFIHEAHNLALKLPIEKAEDRIAILGVVDATFHDTRLWRQVDLATWDEENMVANYQGDANLVRVYEYVPNAQARS